jgi:ABC-type nitrate/sulfonate/bicarbonate transport system permease component
MAELIVYCVITVALIAAFFFAWFFYQQARNKERMILIEKGESLDEIFRKQRNNQIRFSFPWLKLGNVILGLSFGFGLISIYFMNMQNHELFQGFFITFIIGMSLGIPMIVNHVIQRKKVQE